MPRVLFWCWTEPETTSGSPVILCDLANHLPKGCAEIFCEARFGHGPRREIKLHHPIRRFRWHNRLWPFSRGSRVRSFWSRLLFPWLVLCGIIRVWRFKPTHIITIYIQPHWILSAYLVARLTRTPLIYYVHDAFRENNESLGRVSRAFSRWLERVSLTQSQVWVLHSKLADRYLQRYGVRSSVLRQMIRQQPLPSSKRVISNRDHATIGFSGAIYGNNRLQLEQLVGIVTADPRLSLRIWTDPTAEGFRKLQVSSDRIEARYESNYLLLLEQLNQCDLLYLPLSFTDCDGLTANALQYAFPTKSLDYLLVDVEILVHCPSHFELAEFFANNRCGQVLNDGDTASLRCWIDSWMRGDVVPPERRRRLQAIELFSEPENRRRFFQLLDDAQATHEQRTAIHHSKYVAVSADDP